MSAGNPPILSDTSDNLYKLVAKNPGAIGKLLNFMGASTFRKNYESFKKFYNKLTEETFGTGRLNMDAMAMTKSMPAALVRGTILSV